MNPVPILIIGSSNTDMVIKTSHFPVPGETILGGEFLMNPGGKGANQAVAAARLGGKVTFICKIGDDLFGKQAKQLFENEDINTDYLLTDDHLPSGTALITIDASGENTIVVAPGANGNLTVENIKLAEAEFDKCDFILTQLETPLQTVEYIAKLASKKGKKLILNPAPAVHLSDVLLSNLFMITPNETEAELLTGVQVTDVSSAKKAAEELVKKGVKNVIITLGASGAYVLTSEVSDLISAEKVDAVDTTAAGDTFNGGLVTALAKGKSILDAVRFANSAAAISVTRMGAQASIPYLKELE
ncbi:MAG: ribokinase [Bacteroidota bacterium]